jgi:serine/threonine protein phosphatase PrpC
VVVQEPGAVAGADDAPPRHWRLWAVIDGHGGPDAGRHAARLLPEELARRMPKRPLLDGAERGAATTADYAERVRAAATAAFLAASLRLQGGPARPGISREQGATATVAIQTGRLLTIANVGAVKAVVDVAAARVEVTRDHRIGCDEDEDSRLAMGERHLAGDILLHGNVVGLVSVCICIGVCVCVCVCVRARSHAGVRVGKLEHGAA